MIGLFDPVAVALAAVWAVASLGLAGMVAVVLARPAWLDRRERDASPGAACAPLLALPGAAVPLAGLELLCELDGVDWRWPEGR